MKSVHSYLAKTVHFSLAVTVFYNPVLTVALTDRLTHRAYMVDMIGPSYRILDTKEWLENIQP